jgi:hypothetical protein
MAATPASAATGAVCGCAGEVGGADRDGGGGVAANGGGAGAFRRGLPTPPPCTRPNRRRDDGGDDWAMEPIGGATAFSITIFWRR